MIDRILSQQILESKKSIFLLGPRQIGKTTLLNSIKPEMTINLAKEREFQDHLNDPGLIEDLIEMKNPKTVLVDEIQRLPKMLNTIQAIIDEKKIQFFLTGSSARKLKRGQANLLPGRVLNKKLFPLTVKEINYKINTRQALSWGFLPGIFLEENEEIKQELLSSYVSNYLKEEIQQEALTRNLQGYSRFINVLPEWMGKTLDYSKLAAKNKLNRFAVHRFFEIFEETLLGDRIFGSALLEDVPSVKHPRFYFFDNGIPNGILNNYQPTTDYLGSQCETIIYNQIKALLTYKNKNFTIEYLRTHQGVEVDFVVQQEKNTFAIEVKSSDRLSSDDVYALNYLKKRMNKIDSFLFHFGTKSYKIDGIWCLNWLEGLKEFQ